MHELLPAVCFVALNRARDVGWYIGRVHAGEAAGRKVSGQAIRELGPNVMDMAKAVEDQCC